VHVRDREEIDLRLPIGIFVLVFWPVSTVLALLDGTLFRGHVPFPVALALGAVAGGGAVWKHQVVQRRKAAEQAGQQDLSYSPERTARRGR
jgi:hypothetical protein